MKDTTLLFLIRRNPVTQTITHVLLAMKKRGFGVGRWNGVGGKLDEGESIEDAAIRETHEEIGVFAQGLRNVAQLAFTFDQKPEWNQLVHVYFCEGWENEPTESEEMKPEWFDVEKIPFSEMWPDDPFWLPKVIDGHLIKAAFTFGEGDVILDQQVESVESL